MTRGGLLDLLVPDAVDRRAIEETLADWREERRQSRGLARIMTDARSLIACVRVLAGIVTAPYRRVEIWRFLLCSLAAAIGIGMFVNIDMLVRPLTIAGSTTLWLSIVPASAALGLALTASAGLGLRRGQRVPLPAAAIGMLALLVPLHGWVVPEGNQRFREAVFVELGSQGSLPVRGTAELTLPMLLNALSSPDQSERTRAGRLLTRKATLLCLSVAVIALGEAIRRRLPRRWRWGMVQIVSGACAVGVAVGSLAVITPALGWLPWPVELSVPPLHVRWFATTGVVLLLTVWLSRRTQEPEPRT